ncbi:SCP-like protein [Oesophagostomum dentatum]|uniref:SCP-like protein n=1 Tax=Oesophagostomum dentatum TaxID=61180 RepID=A0A0B1SUG7_OESDE|nr:SCP-like protein [Oesophagostomum dentatum]
MELRPGEAGITGSQTVPGIYTITFSIKSEKEYDLNNPYNLALKRWVLATHTRNFTGEFDGDCAILPFANMVRSNTTEVGCSERRCGNVSAIACIYNSPTLEEGDAIYDLGNGCAIDSDCTTYPNSYCEVESNLCVKNEAVLTKDEEITRASHATAAFTFAEGTKEYNLKRSLVARGFALKRNGRRLPPAANMRKLKYNCELEILAFAYASTCTLDTSDPMSRTKTGENMAAISVNNAATFEEALEKMAWAETEEVGGALGECGKKYNLVCRYYPRGIQEGQLVYYPDEPCKKCPWHMRCEFRTGLCMEVEDEERPAHLSEIKNFSHSKIFFSLTCLLISPGPLGLERIKFLKKT